MYQKSYREIFESMRNYIIAHQDKITDFNEGSVALSIIEATARELVSLYNKCISNVELYSKDMAYAQFDFTKKNGTTASGSVIFSRKVSSSLSVSIPVGAIISTKSGLKFTTTADGIITAGSKESGLIPASCNGIGDVGNIGSNKINTIENSIYGVDYVRNNAAFTGGVNKETDEEYKVRFNEFIIGLGKSSVSGIRATALSVNGVRSVSLVEHFPAEAGFHFTVYAENGSGALPAKTKLMLEEVICGNDTTEGVRACGVNARILAPTIVYVNPTVVFRVDGSIPPGLIEEEIKKNITNYVNAHKIGEPYEKKSVYNMSIRQLGVSDITTITPNTTAITKRQIIRLGTLKVEGV